MHPILQLNSQNMKLFHRLIERLICGCSCFDASNTDNKSLKNLHEPVIVSHTLVVKNLIFEFVEIKKPDFMTATWLS